MRLGGAARLRVPQRGVADHRAARRHARAAAQAHARRAPALQLYLFHVRVEEHAAARLLHAPAAPRV